MLVVATFYRFFKVISCANLKAKLKNLIDASDIYGTIIVASEGINGTVCGSRASIDKLVDFFKDAKIFLGMEYKESFTDTNPFFRRQIKIKREIVTLGDLQLDPQQSTGSYVDSRQWDELLMDARVLVLDVRNRYETAIGTFIGALDPELNSFREFPAFVKKRLDPFIHKRIAMSCTGGIRCEKASSYLKHQGFDEVYQLKGGILKYLEDTPKNMSKWQGECFVFDQRVAVTHDRMMGSYTMCFGCRSPLSDEDRKSSLYIDAVCCSKCYQALTETKYKSRKTRREQIALALARGHQHLGPHAMPKN